MKKILLWIRAMRPQFFTAAVMPVILGSAIAWYDAGTFRWDVFCLALFGAIAVHAGLNLTNDYYDFKSKDDVVNKTPTPFSGGSRLLPEGILKPRSVLLAGLACFGITAVIGLYLLCVVRGYPLLIIGATGMFLAFFYTAGPLRIGYTRLAELATGIGFGPLMVLGSYYVQARRLSWGAFWASVPAGILIALVLFINEFPDYEADRISGKRNTVVSLGKKKAVVYYRLFLLSVYPMIAGGVALRVFPMASLMTFLTLPLAFLSVKTASKNFDKIKELLPANALTIIIHLTFNVLFSLAYIVRRF